MLIFLHTKILENYVDPTDHTGNESILDIPTGGSGQDLKMQNGKNLPYVINMLIMKHVHHLRTEIMEGENLQIVPKSTTVDFNPTCPTI